METNFKFKQLTWNVNGITPHILELQTILNVYNIDIAMISESYLTPTKTIKILGYKAYQSNHPDTSVHAGSVILVRNNLTHSLLSVTSETYLQATSILVSLNEYINLTLSYIYCALLLVILDFEMLSSDSSINSQAPGKISSSSF